MATKTKTSNRAASRIVGLFGKTIDPMVLESELYRLHPEITDIEKIPINQLDLLLTTTYNKIMVGPVVSGRQVFEDLILPKLPRMPVTDADKSLTKGVKMEQDRFYHDDPIRLQKAQGMQLIDQFRKKAAEIGRKRAIIGKKRSIAQKQVDELPREWNYGQEELEALESQIKEQIDAWTTQMDSLVRKMMNSMDLESLGDFVNKYSEFKRALKYSINNIKWQAMDKAREELASAKPVAAIAKSMGAMRNLGNTISKGYFDHDLLKSVESNIVSYFDEDEEDEGTVGSYKYHIKMLERGDVAPNRKAAMRYINEIESHPTQPHIGRVIRKKLRAYINHPDTMFAGEEEEGWKQQK